MRRSVRRRAAALVFVLCVGLLVLEATAPGLLGKRSARWWYGNRLIASSSSDEARERGVLIRRFTAGRSGIGYSTKQPRIDDVWLERGSERAVLEYPQPNVLYKGTWKPQSRLDPVDCPQLCIRLVRPDGGDMGDLSVTRVEDGQVAIRPAEENPMFHDYGVKRLVMVAPLKDPYHLEVSGKDGTIVFSLSGRFY